jgi:murein DD-endopeptidase MepM/ murein hydrolase activator NlpD
MRYFGLSLCLVALMTTALVSGQTRAKKVETLKKNLQSVQGKKEEIRSQLRATKREAGAVMADIEQADARLESLQERLATTIRKLEWGRQEQARLKGELRQATEKLESKKQEMQERLRQQYMQPGASVLTAVVKAESLGELASRRALMEMVARKDRELFEEVKSLQEAVAVKKKRQDDLVGEIASLAARQKREQAELKVARRQKESYLGELREHQQDLQEEYDQLIAESRALEAQIRAYQAARRASGTEVSPFRGSLLMPIAGGRVGSGYGQRFHPILKRTRMHTGVDIGASTGTPIRAAAPGVVISANYRGGYGNCVVIDHGGGLSTLYGHCSRLYVSAGQRVSRGQTIAAVGSTGLSTGPHLHFEVRINGAPVNPMGRL